MVEQSRVCTKVRIGFNPNRIVYAGSILANANTTRHPASTPGRSLGRARMGILFGTMPGDDKRPHQRE